MSLINLGGSFISGNVQRDLQSVYTDIRDDLGINNNQNGNPSTFNSNNNSNKHHEWNF